MDLSKSTIDIERWPAPPLPSSLPDYDGYDVENDTPPRPPKARAAPGPSLRRPLRPGRRPRPQVPLRSGPHSVGSGGCPYGPGGLPHPQAPLQAA